MLLARAGKLDLDKEVRAYLAELPDYDAAHPLRVRHLLHHTGGVREWSSLALFAAGDDGFEQRLDHRDVLRLPLRQKSLEFRPGSRNRYSSGGYQLLTAVIERVAGMRLGAFAAPRSLPAARHRRHPFR